jgi:hypothetical protein
MRIDGPSLGPIHTTLWSSGRRKRGPVPFKGWLIAYFTTAALWGISPVAGIVATVVLAVIIAVAVRARRQARKGQAS